MAGSPGQQLRRRSDLLWDDPSRPSRGPKPALSREDVVAAAIALADQEGLRAATMHAVADRLGFTTMALYRYFPSKQALMDAIVDAAWGTPPDAAPARGYWREEARRWAHAKRAVRCARPWLAELPFVAAPHGPNWLGWLEDVLSAFSGTGLGAADMFEIVNVLDAYVRGGSDTAVARARALSRGIPNEEWAAAVRRDLHRAVDDARFPTLSSLLTSDGGVQPRTLEEGFEFGLERVLDGIALYIDAH